MHISLELPVLLPRISNFDWPEAAMRFYVVSIDAKVQETRRIPAGACVPNQGVASARRYVGKDDVLAVTWRWPRSAIDSGPCFAVVERHLIVQPVPSVPGAVVRAKPQSDYVAGSSHWKSDRPRS